MTITFWILLAVSDGTHAQGEVAVVAKFWTKEDCAAAMGDLIPAMKQRTKWQCLQVKAG